MCLWFISENNRGATYAMSFLLFALLVVLVVVVFVLLVYYIVRRWL
jgi:hypothetical protein